MSWLTFTITWFCGAGITFFVARSLMPAVYSYLIILVWCLFAWPLYLVLVIILALKNP